MIELRIAFNKAAISTTEICKSINKLKEVLTMTSRKELLLGIENTIDSLLTQIMYTKSPAKAKKLSVAVKNLSNAYRELSEAIIK